MPGSEPIYLEVGKRWVFACSVEWPGWCRRARSPDAAVASLVEYAPRYRAAIGPACRLGAPHVVGTVEGSATTDFGAPGAWGPWDAEPLAGAVLDRQVATLEAAWRAFDATVAASPPALRKGPRGGGRDRDQIAEHVREAERTYARKAGLRLPPRTPWDHQRASIAAALREGDWAGQWPRRYALRRIAWHLLDHAWEIEDRVGP